MTCPSSTCACQACLLRTTYNARASTVTPYQEITYPLYNVEISTTGTTTVPDKAPPPDLSADYRVIETALQSLMWETRFEALGKIALEALERVRRSSV